MSNTVSDNDKAPKVLDEMIARETFQNALRLNWTQQENHVDITFEADLNEIIKCERILGSH